MPERIFAYNTFDELRGFAAALSKAITTGSTLELRNNHTGFSKTTGGLTQTDVRRRLMEVRYEIYWRGQNGTEPEKGNCATLEPNNPLQEKIMRVESCYPSWNYLGV